MLAARILRKLLKWMLEKKSKQIPCVKFIGAIFLQCMNYYRYYKLIYM